MNNCNILYDLPPENALRKELSKMKAKLEEFVDKFLDLEFVFYVPLQSQPLLGHLLNIAFHVKLPHLSSGLTNTADDDSIDDISSQAANEVWRIQNGAHQWLR